MVTNKMDRCVSDVIERLQETRNDTITEEYSSICELFSYSPNYDRSFIWSDGDMLLFADEDDMHVVEAYLQDNFPGCVTVTGYYDPKEDEEYGTADCYTGFYCLTID